MYQKVTSIEEIRDAMNSHPAIIAFFSHENCSVCQVIKPELSEKISKVYPSIHLIETDIGENPGVAADYSVFTAPVVVLFLNGREFIRKTRNFSISEFIHAIDRPYRLMLE